MIAIGVQAPANVPIDITTDTTFVKGFLSTTNIVFAYGMAFCTYSQLNTILMIAAAHVAFFGFMSEMEDAREFPKSLAMMQISQTCLYVITSMVIYCYAGPDVGSPALSSAGPVMKKVGYGLAIPTVSLRSYLSDSQ